MRNSRAIILWVLISLGSFFLFGCEQAREALSSKHPTYSSCLQQAVAGSTNLSAEEIRSICAETAQVIDASYTWTEQGTIPSNDFTSCYDKEKKLLEESKVSQASRLAKLSCKYLDVK